MQCDSEQLVALVVKIPALYDHSMKQHSNRSITNKLWNEIAKEMKCTAVECKARWLRLRSAFSRYIREGQNTPQGRQKRKWYMADQMKFLVKHISHQKNAPNPFDSKSEAEQQHLSTISATKKRENSIDISIWNSDLDYDSNTSNNQHSSRGLNTRNRKTISAKETVTDSLVKYLRLKTEQTKIEADPDSMFFKSMLADYKNLTRKRKRYFRELMVTTMNKLQEEDENDEPQVGRCSSNDSVVDIKYEV